MMRINNKEIICASVEIDTLNLVRSATYGLGINSEKCIKMLKLEGYKSFK